MFILGVILQDQSVPGTGLVRQLHPTSVIRGGGGRIRRCTVEWPVVAGPTPSARLERPGGGRLAGQDAVELTA